VQVCNYHGLALSVSRNNQRQANRDFSGGYHQDNGGKYLSIDL
jgi:hypothetical protein